MSKPRCKFCNRKFHKKGLANHERFCAKAHGSRHPMSNTESNIVQGVPTPPQLPELRTLDERVERILDGVWNGLSLNEKLEALHGLYFDPSNPNED